MRIIIFSTFFLGAMTILSFPSISLAHGDGGTYENEINGYAVDIGYSPKEPYAGSVVPFDFGLIKDNKNVDFTDLWVRISKEDQTLFAGGIYNASFGGARLSIAFPEGGEYTISARYQNNNEEIVTAEFPLSVAPSATANPNSGFPIMQIMYVILGLFIGILGTIFIRRKK